MELDDKLEIVWERKQYGFEGTNQQITGEQKGSCNKIKREKDPWVAAGISLTEGLET